MMRPSPLIAIVGLCLLLAACASRPSEDALTQAILNATNAENSPVSLSPEQAACIASELLGSELSDTTLSGLADDFDNPQVLETEVNDVGPKVAEAALSCQ